MTNILECLTGSRMAALLALWINRDQNDLKIYDVNINTGCKKYFL